MYALITTTSSKTTQSLFTRNTTSQNSNPINKTCQKQMRYKTTKVGVVGVPFDKGQPKIGVAKAPKLFREAGLIKALQDIHDKMDVKDYGDVHYSIEGQEVTETIPNMKGYQHLVACAQETSKQITQVINDGRICLTLGGDHSIGVATVDGHIQAKGENIGLLWIDAHADLNTNQTSSTGNIHGMPVALLARELSDYWPYLPGMDWQKPVMSIRSIAYIGLRSVDVYERLIINNLGITAYGMEDVERYGIDTVISMAIDRIDPDHDKSLHISLDIDALDPLEAPSTGCCVRGGLTLRETIHIMEFIYRTGRLSAIDLVEVNPSIGSERDVKNTIDAAISAIRAGLGHDRRGRKPRDITDIPFQIKTQTPPLTES